MQWSEILLLLGAILVAFILYRQVKSNPLAFSRENLGKSFGTLAILALLLIAFIAFLVFMLRSG